MTKSKLVPRSGITVVTTPEIMVQKPLEMACRRNLKKFGEAN
jgi:hypothetical protein